TVFLEPLETVEANNQLVQLAEDEAAEIARILRELTERLQAFRGPLESAAATIAELDSVFARARFARDFDAAVPEFSNADRLHLEDARHPVLEDKLKRENRVIVPMSLSLGGEERVLVISGPNTGGKTVALKTVGVAALAAQAGIPVAAQRAILPIFDRVLVDIGDEQSNAADLSTFSAHMLNLKSMLDRLDRKSTRLNSSHDQISYAVFTIPDLPPFPTRRSSDLNGCAQNRWRGGAGGTSGNSCCGTTRHPADFRPRARGYRRRTIKCRGPFHLFCAYAEPEEHARSIRSEEHTSELQSRSDLVCRLHHPRSTPFPYTTLFRSKRLRSKPLAWRRWRHKREFLLRHNAPSCRFSTACSWISATNNQMPRTFPPFLRIC